MHELHRAFGEVIGPHHISEATRLAVYRYAIFILEPPSATPFSPAAVLIDDWESGVGTGFPSPNSVITP